MVINTCEKYRSELKISGHFFVHGRFPGPETEFSLTLTDSGESMIHHQLLMYASLHSMLSKLLQFIHVTYIDILFRDRCKTLKDARKNREPGY